MVPLGRWKPGFDIVGGDRVTEIRPRQQHLTLGLRTDVDSEGATGSMCCRRVRTATSAPATLGRLPHLTRPQWRDGCSVPPRPARDGGPGRSRWSLTTEHREKKDGMTVVLAERCRDQENAGQFVAAANGLIIE
jgi:hypothetical protein